MEVKEIDYAKLNEAIEKFGSLQKVNVQLETDKLALEKENALLKKESEKLITSKNNLTGQAENMSGKVKSCQDQLQSLANKINVYSYQYELFCGFMAIMAESPSVNDSISTIITLFQKLKEPG